MQRALLFLRAFSRETNLRVAPGVFTVNKKMQKLEVETTFGVRQIITIICVHICAKGLLIPTC